MDYVKRRESSLNIHKWTIKVTLHLSPEDAGGARAPRHRETVSPPAAWRPGPGWSSAAAVGPRHQQHQLLLKPTTSQQQQQGCWRSAAQLSSCSGVQQYRLAPDCMQGQARTLLVLGLARLLASCLVTTSRLHCSPCPRRHSYHC